MGYTLEDLTIFNELQERYPNTWLKLKWDKPLHDEDWEECPIITLRYNDYDVIVANPRLGYEFCEKMLKDLLDNYSKVR